MSLLLFGHPFASYCWKAEIALYENKTPFEFRMLDQEHPENFAEFERLWPLKKFPLLLDGGRPIAEATVIIEHLAAHYPGSTKLIPADPDVANEVRFLDRFFDNYIHEPMQRIVFNSLRKPEERDPRAVTDAQAQFEQSYAWLEPRMAKRQWAAGDQFTMADCAAGPALFYADWTHRIPERFPNVIAYRKRLNARPSFARVIEEARPFRHFFPLGAPDRD